MGEGCEGVRGKGVRVWGKGCIYQPNINYKKHTKKKHDCVAHLCI